MQTYIFKQVPLIIKFHTVSDRKKKTKPLLLLIYLPQFWQF